MCGIAGEFALKDKPADRAALGRMLDCMVRRGPDADGMIVRGNVALGHRRLKIIDLSEAAQQPMTDPHLGLSIVFNGAIYNYPQLRGELQQAGYRFFSNGDTEVILKAYHHWGTACVEKFNGMFAFAIHERDSGRLFLARDRLGIKPVYLAETNDQRIRFASSLHALLAAGGVDTSIDPVALHHYMTFHAVVPAPHTILKGVRKLPPGHRMTIEPDGRRQIEPFWQLSFHTPEDRANWSEDDWQDATLDVMRRAVKRRLIADVPVGVLLSGGLDSSLITGLLCENGASVKTFSIGFESVGGESGDEFEYSDLVVERFNTDHTKLFIDTARALPALRDCIGTMSEPMVSHDNVGFYLLSEEVSKHVKVVQSGQGADEIFAGYHWYPPMLESTDAIADYRRHFFDRDHDDFLQAVEPRWHGDDHSLEFLKRHFDLPGAPCPVDKALRIDSLIMLVDDPVKRVDNNTMAHGLEARVPFLDHEVVEFAASVPAELKVRGGGKYILAEAARRVIPKGVIDRPKGYFPVPALKYLRGEFLELARSTVLSDKARDRGLFQRAYVDRLLADPEGHITPLRGSKLWQLTLLELWLQTHNL